DQNAHHNDERVQNQFESLREGKREHQQRGGKSTDNAKEELDPHEAIHKAAIDKTREGAADAHCEQVGTNNGGELKNAVADEIAGERAGNELIDEATRRQLSRRRQRFSILHHYWNLPDRNGHRQRPLSLYQSRPCESL